MFASDIPLYKRYVTVPLWLQAFIVIGWLWAVIDWLIAMPLWGIIAGVVFFAAGWFLAALAEKLMGDNAPDFAQIPDDVGPTSSPFVDTLAQTRFWLPGVLFFGLIASIQAIIVLSHVVTWLF